MLINEEGHGENMRLMHGHFRVEKDNKRLANYHCTKKKIVAVSFDNFHLWNSMVSREQ